MWLSMVGIVICAIIGVKGDAKVMSHVTAHFGQSLDECREESGLTVDLMEAFHHFWRDDYVVARRELGCAIICMSDKFSLMHEDGTNKVHHSNMQDYIKSFPNGDILSEKMLNMIQDCELQYTDIAEKCERVVQTAACFKDKARVEGIAPEIAMMEAVLEKYK